MTNSKLCMLSLILFILLNVCDSLPILPIIKAIAGSGANALNVDVDVLGIAKYVKETAKLNKNRSGFVKDLMYTAFHKSDHKYNVIVFNLNEEHRHKLEGIKFYASSQYTDGTKFGIWVFDSGFFINKGARGWDNWAMIGSFTKNKAGNVVTFRRRVTEKKINSNKIPEFIDLDNVFCERDN